MSERHFVIEMQSRHVAALVLVNGCVVCDAWDARPRVMELPIDPFVAEVTRLEVFLAPLAPRPDPEERAFALRLCRPRHGAPASEITMRLTYRWSEDSALAPEGLTKVVDHSFRVAECLPAPWDHGRAYRDEERPALDGLFLRLHHAIASRDPDALRLLLARKIADLSAAFQQSPSGLEAEVLAELGELWDQPDFRIQPAALQELVVDARLGGRLVHLRDRSGRPPIFASAGKRIVTMPASMSFVDNAWTLVR